MKKTSTLLLSLLLALSVLFSVPVSAQTLGLLPDTVRRPAAGVTETEYSTQTEDGKPVRYFVLDTAYGLPGSHLKIGVGLPNNGTSFGMQKLTEQLAAIRAGGTNVLAGVNGDFYNMVTGEPEGLFVKDGVPLHGWSAPNALPDSLGRIPYRTFFGIKSDGRAVIGGRTVYDSVKGCLQQAIGGAFMLVENGQPVKVRYPASVRSFVENRHPRTAVGIRRNGNLSNSSIETLAVIAYNQPVTRSSIEFIRGVNSDGPLNNLVAAGLVKEMGRLDAPGRPILFGTTDDFLRSFNLSSLTELPDIDKEYSFEGLNAELSGAPILIGEDELNKDQIKIDFEIETEEEKEEAEPQQQTQMLLDE